jgi:hypothetical protein
MFSAFPFFVLGPNNAYWFVDDPDVVFKLIQYGESLGGDQSFSEALQDEWSDEDTRLEVFGEDFTEDTLQDALDLCEIAEHLSQGFIL